MTSYFAQILTIQYFTLSWFQGKYFEIQVSKFRVSDQGSQFAQILSPYLRTF